MARTATAPGVPTTRLGKAALEVDDRLIVAGWLRRTMNKVYPDHWSFLLGEIALYSFIVLLLSGTYLTFFFDASMREVVYNGSYDLLSGTGLRIASAIMLAIPVVGTWVHFAVFNGDYVGEAIIGRFYIVHVL